MASFVQLHQYRQVRVIRCRGIVEPPCDPTLRHRQTTVRLLTPERQFPAYYTLSVELPQGITRALPEDSG